MLTAGLGAYFWMTRGNHSKGALSRLLISRGIWLIALEVTVLRLIMFSQISFTANPVLLIILWAIGLSMITLAELIYLPMRVLMGISIAIIALHKFARRCFGRALRSSSVDLGHSISARCYRLAWRQVQARISGAELDWRGSSRRWGDSCREARRGGAGDRRPFVLGASRSRGSVADGSPELMPGGAASTSGCGADGSMVRKPRRS